MEWLLAAFRKYAVFTGRARRKEYWGFVLANFIVIILLSFVFGNANDPRSMPWPVYLYTLAVLLPAIGVGIRRMHDQDRTGWWLLITLVPFIGGLIFFILALLPGTAGANRFGPDPRHQSS